MKKLLLFLLLIFTLEASFFEDEDPAFYRNVNVITGHLNLSFEDLTLSGPVPFTLFRSYSSSGAENPNYSYISGLKHSSWVFQGGWKLLPHAHLLIHFNGGSFGHFALPEKSGAFIEYRYSKSRKCYVPKFDREKKTPKLNPRKELRNNRLYVFHRHAELHRPDGSKCYYSGKGRSHCEDTFWRLDLEVLPSKHRVVYHYNLFTKRLEKIELQNPSGDKTFGFLTFAEDSLTVESSDQASIHYCGFTSHKDRCYLGKVQSNVRPTEEIHYKPYRGTKGACMRTLCFEGQGQLEVAYEKLPVFPEKEEPKSTPLKREKVTQLLLPDPETGKLELFAKFSYEPNCTEVCDYEGVKKRYYHEDGLVQKVETFDLEGNLFTSTEYCWDGYRLMKKTLSDASGTPIFSKRFTYDKHGGIYEEFLEDHRTAQPPIIRTSAHHYSTSLLMTEKDPSGLITRYKYLKDTDLITERGTYSPARELLHKQRTFYDKDHLVAKITLEDSEGERCCQIFTRDPETGKTLSITHSAQGVEEKTIHYRYNEKGRIASETTTFPDGTSLRLEFSYDAWGNLIRKTSPTGRVSTYRYDAQGRKLEEKEVGEPRRLFTYDGAGRLRTVTEGEEEKHTVYDFKGRLISYTDACGNPITQKYNCFGKCIETTYSEVEDDQGTTYAPSIHFTYDLLGNQVSCTNPLGETTQTRYDILNNTTETLHPDGSQTRYLYREDTSLEKTLHPDGSETHYTYDCLQRLLHKAIYSKEGELLSEESWIYDAFHLLSHTTPLGLTTTYTYDLFGRKIREEAEGRVTTYAYDPQGNLIATTKNGVTSRAVYNLEGEVIEQWEEDSSGKIENWMSFTYDEEGRKASATRKTSKGEAKDTFAFDEKGRLTRHTDPLGATTEIQYTRLESAVQKTIIDPIGNRTIETLDANGKITTIERQAPDGTPVALEERFYDRAGNFVRRLSHVFEDSRILRTHTTEWEHNERGWVTKEIEEGTKTTTYAYDSSGNPIEKTDPRGITLYQSYDALGRLVEQKSSDGTLHNQFEYEAGPLPIQATDLIHNLTWERTYNLFGEITSETTPDGAVQTWTYDTAGRVTLHTLPDGSAIAYTHIGSHLTQVTRITPEGTASYSHHYTQFDENGHVCEEELIYSRGTVTTEHDLLERPCGRTSPWNTASLEYGPSGLVTQNNNTFFRNKTYQYDPLNQLTQEGEKEHHFDSLGNPLSREINHLNQITRYNDTHCTYDASGNLLQKESSSSTRYTYDALGRLTTIQNETLTTYQYDPFSRLYAKTTPTSQHYYLHNPHFEIGTYDKTHRLLELKVLGLAIRGDVGGAIAIELEGVAHAPLHDFQGNVIGVVAPNGGLQETLDVDAFGEILLTRDPISPWSFSSKRSEGTLVYFGNRFYDPELGRFLTPDPSGSHESANLYLYVRNNPLNRLDLFGLSSETFRAEVRLADLNNPDLDFYPVQYYTHDEYSADGFMASNQIHRLQFTPEELESETVNILDHVPELVGTDGAIQTVLYGNGIKNKKKDHLAGFASVKDNIEKHSPGSSCLYLSVFKPTQGFIGDVSGVGEQVRGIQTAEVLLTRQLFVACSETLDRIHQDNSFLAVSHSGGAGLFGAAILGMNEHEIELTARKLHWLGIAPAMCMPLDRTRTAQDYYSSQDFFTGWAGIMIRHLTTVPRGEMGNLPPIQSVEYNIEFLDCITPRNELYFGIIDHSILQPTQQLGMQKGINYLERRGGFYKNAR